MIRLDTHETLDVHDAIAWIASTNTSPYDEHLAREYLGGATIDAMPDDWIDPSAGDPALEHPLMAASADRIVRDSNWYQARPRYLIYDLRLRRGSEALIGSMTPMSDT